MQLKKIRIQNFQSVIDSNEFEIGDVTCLVGKNEAKDCHAKGPLPAQSIKSQRFQI